MFRPSVPNNDNVSPNQLHQAVLDNNYDEVVRILGIIDNLPREEDRLSLLNSRHTLDPLLSGLDFTLLHVAAWKGSSTFIQLLVKAGADVNLQDAQGNTPLQILARHLDDSIYEVMIGEFLNEPDKISKIHPQDDPRLEYDIQAATKSLFKNYDQNSINSFDRNFSQTIDDFISLQRRYTIPINNPNIYQQAQKEYADTTIAMRDTYQQLLKKRAEQEEAEELFGHIKNAANKS